MYDFENRLVEVKRLPTELSPAYVTIAKYWYDALGRRIKEVHWDKLEAKLSDQTYYYDGQNVVAVCVNADMPPSENLTTYFIHGLRYIDERAVMHDVSQNEEYYYVLGQNWNVEALLNNRGREVEHYSYDAYGQPVITAVSVFDVDFDGDIDMFDQNAIWFRIGQTPCTQAPPWYDLDGDGDIDSADHGSFTYGPALVEIPESGLGNPYAFTSRWMDHFDYVNGVPRKMLMHYRGRTYDQLHGRFNQRDLLLYVDGMNLYEYVKSQPTNRTDPRGQVALRATPQPSMTGNWKGGLKSTKWYWASVLKVDFNPSKQVQDGCCKEITVLQIVRSKWDGGLGIRDKWNWHPDEDGAGATLGNPWRSKHAAFPADFRDEPGYTIREYETFLTGPPRLVQQEFVTCAVCTKGSHEGKYKILSCFEWRHKFKPVVPSSSGPSWIDFDVQRWASVGSSVSGDAMGRAVVRYQKNATPPAPKDPAWKIQGTGHGPSHGFETLVAPFVND